MIAKTDLIEQLFRLGWLVYQNATQAHEEVKDNELKGAVQGYQAFHGLQVDGEVGPQTEASLFSVRFCGHPDVMPLSAELNKWPEPQIRWWLDLRSLQGLPISSEVAGQAIDWAWKEWQKVCGILPSRVSEHGQAQVRIAFGRIDVPGRVLAYSELADGSNRPKGQMYDTAEHWTFSERPAQNTIDLGRVACHEIGHMLGLPHIQSGNLLQPTYDTRIRVPQPGDIAEVQSRYGPPLEVPPDVIPPPSIRIPAGMGLVVKTDGDGMIATVARLP